MIREALSKDASGDFVSSCGMFKIANVSSDKYLPMIRQGDGDEKPVVYAGVTRDYVSLLDAMKILENY